MKSMPVCPSYSENGWWVFVCFFGFVLFGVFVVTFCLVGVFYSVSVLLLYCNGFTTCGVTL